MIAIDLIIAFFWALYMVLEAYREAYYWYFRWKSSRWYPNLHIIFLIQRMIVFIPVFIFGSWNCIISCVAVSPFFHNSFYYLFRNDIDGAYPKGLMSQSENSTAFSTKFFTPIVRIILLIIGISTLFINIK